VRPGTSCSRGSSIVFRVMSSPSEYGEYSLASLIQTMGTQAFPDSFAGARRLPNGQVEVHVVGAQGTDFLNALPPVEETPIGPSYVIVDAANSWAALKAMTRRIAEDDSILRGVGILLAGWGPDVDTNTVEIRLFREYSVDVAQYLLSRYGSEMVSVAKEPVMELPRRL
jgi:hypothetical protein